MTVRTVNSSSIPLVKSNDHGAEPPTEAFGEVSPVSGASHLPAAERLRLVQESYDRIRRVFDPYDTTINNPDQKAADHPPATDYAYQARAFQYHNLLGRLQQLDKTNLAPIEQQNLELLEYALQKDIEQYRFKAHMMPMGVVTADRPN